MAIVKRLRRLIDKAIVTSLYRRRSYLDAYSAHTDRRVRQDPQSAVGDGELWHVVGQLQFDYLVGKGLTPAHRLLDIGCGTLRGGQHFIRHLEPAGYTGIDISSEAIAYSNKFVETEKLTEKQPRLLVSQHRDLKFTEFANEHFDFILAQSVFTHLMAEHIEECFAHIGAIMQPSSSFFFTFKEADAVARPSKKAFRYPFKFFQELADRHRFTVELMNDYNHPLQARMARLAKR
jgi:SAM-dependent methyltransferase